MTADPTQLPVNFMRLPRWAWHPCPEPWTVEDILAWTALMLRQFDPGQQTGDSSAMRHSCST
ncbi:MAG: hypothetical protein R2874_08890 [Desulfobacterales bacterium]